MPIYVYTCDECETEVEILTNIGGLAPTCSKCGGAMQRKYSPIAFFKMKGMGGYPSLRKAYQAGGRNLVEDAKKTLHWV